jgi:hypothetical protein
MPLARQSASSEEHRQLAHTGFFLANGYGTGGRAEAAFPRWRVSGDGTTPFTARLYSVGIGVGSGGGGRERRARRGPIGTAALVAHPLPVAV